MEGPEGAIRVKERSDEVERVAKEIIYRHDYDLNGVLYQLKKLPATGITP